MTAVVGDVSIVRMMPIAMATAPVAVTVAITMALTVTVAAATCSMRDARVGRGNPLFIKKNRSTGIYHPIFTSFYCTLFIYLYCAMARRQLFGVNCDSSKINTINKEIRTQVDE